jgi:hypothetical protein
LDSRQGGAVELEGIEPRGLSPLDEVVEATRARSLGPPPSTGPLVAECVDARHPVLAGRVRVRWCEAGVEQEGWLPTLQALVVRVGDRVLVQRAMNWPEPLVVGVVDGFAHRPDPPRHEAARLTLERDEALRITTPEGEPLVEVARGERGPVVRLLRPDVEVELAGALRVSAAAIELRAREGEVRVEASADVCVVGENVNLN